MPGTYESHHWATNCQYGMHWFRQDYLEARYCLTSGEESKNQAFFWQVFRLLKCLKISYFGVLRKFFLSFTKICSVSLKFAQFWQKISSVLEIFWKFMKFQRKIAIFHCFRDPLWTFKHLKISYFSVLVIFLSFAKNRLSVSTQILSKKSLLCLKQLCQF